MIEREVIMKKIIMLTALVCALCGTGSVCRAASGNHNICVVGSFYDLKSDTDYIDCYAIKNDGSLWLWRDTKQNEGIDKAVSAKIADNVKSIHQRYFITNDNVLYELYKEHYFDLPTPRKVTEDVEGFNDCWWHECIIKTDGSLWVRGTNGSYGFMNEDSSLKSEEFIKLMNNAESVSGGHYHTAVLKTDGTVWTYGFNQRGQIGDGTYNNSYRQKKIMSNISSINTGVMATYAITDDNILWRWGNNCAELTDSHDYDFLSPVKYLEDVKQVCNKQAYNVVLKTNGDLWLYGENETDEYIQENSEVYNFSYPKKIMENITAITDETTGGETCGYILALDNDGNLYKVSEVFNGPNSKLVMGKVMDDVKLPEEKEPKEVKEFEDVKEGSKYYEAVTHLTRAGITDGVTDTEFKPEKELSRAETAAMLLRMTGKRDQKGDVNYIDVTADKWYYDIAGANARYGMMDGFEDNTFRGEDAVTDIQLAALAGRSLRSEGTGGEGEEAPSAPANIPDWAKADVEYAMKYGILTEEELKAMSGKSMTRGEAAVILYRLYNVI